MVLYTGRLSLVAAWLGAALLGCATSDRLEWSPDAIRQEVQHRVSDAPTEAIVVPYEVEAEALERARAAVRGESGKRERMDRLLASLSDPGGFGLRYAWALTASADETLLRREGNCFSLSSVLIGLARGVGLKAYYVEVKITDHEWRHTGDVAIVSDHIGAVIFTSEGRQYVDFSGRLDRSHRLRVIDDLEALAHFYNNRGYEMLYLAERGGSEPPWSRVLASFNMATRIEPALAQAWNNLGVARSHLGDAEGAERAYRTALGLAGDMQSAHLNLVVLYLRSGDLDAADDHLRAAERLDSRNPQLEELRATLVALRDASRSASGG
jgi:tetratricopeptide (TPR) repeat protein